LISCQSLIICQNADHASFCKEPEPFHTSERKMH
jgi:hypothetical protein